MARVDQAQTLFVFYSVARRWCQRRCNLFSPWHSCGIIGEVANGAGLARCPLFTGRCGHLSLLSGRPLARHLEVPDRHLHCAGGPGAAGRRRIDDLAIGYQLAVLRTSY
jgi:hypothetical protein